MKGGAFILLILFCYCTGTTAQTIQGVAVMWEDDPSEWVIYSDSLKENEIGTIKKRWENRNDIWDYTIGASSGTIRMKRKGNPEKWQVRSDQRTSIARTIWPRDLSAWIILDSAVTIRYRMRYSNSPEEWETEISDEYGYFAMWTDWEGDIRSWTIYDDLIEEKVHIESKVLMIFLPIWINVFGEFRSR